MSWKHFGNADFLGTSPFQNLCCREIWKFLPDLEFSEEGELQKTFVANILSPNIELYLYFDSVEMKSPAAEIFLAPAEFERPEDLVARLITELSNSI